MNDKPDHHAHPVKTAAVRSAILFDYTKDCKIASRLAHRLQIELTRRWPDWFLSPTVWTSG